MDKDLAKALKKLHKAVEAQTKVLKRIEKSIRAENTSEDEEIDTIGCTRHECICKSKWQREICQDETGRSFGI